MLLTILSSFHLIRKMKNVAKEIIKHILTCIVPCLFHSTLFEIKMICLGIKATLYIIAVFITFDNTYCIMRTNLLTLLKPKATETLEKH